LEAALTHKSHAFEHPRHVSEWNERLEFFGDSVLGLVVSEYLFKRFKNLQEGELSKLKASVVCTETLKKHAQRIDIGRFLLLGRGEERSGGRSLISNLSCALEAVIGAVYLDKGLNAAKKFILEIFKTDLHDLHKSKNTGDYKSLFQEQCLKKFGQIPFYEVISQDGPEHKKEFVVAVRLSSHTYGRGWGYNKKSAEQMAAREALENLDKNINRGYY
jgi:ribonuclease-3